MRKNQSCSVQRFSKTTERTFWLIVQRHYHSIIEFVYIVAQKIKNNLEFSPVQKYSDKLY